MATVRKRSGSTRSVKNLGWFFRKARTTVISDLTMERVASGWKMTATFDDGEVFTTPYADINVFKQVMGRQRSLKGLVVRVIDGDNVDELRFSTGRRR